ncbi:LytTR family DNA-binding domain-containing protein [Roseivirga sp. E12]|uniref:LytR/AlgR family response regulator transcription factor n=1 Tax=Roseivirga sp. E12 TaxID=2819237 RepID=UPI001ABD0042|nr:LytTR family DNA-binding domain-containing protein [Roseivirga sp. E12]MBO3697731.1 response regulator transcription factor [Roseivirga sp. E12]
MMLNCVIIEDERLARQKLQLYVNDHKHLTLVASFVSAEEFIKKANNVEYDLLLLDIALPNMDGITLAGMLPKHCRVVFTTAFAEHAVEAFNLNATDYLLKPFDFERFSKAIEKVNSFTNPPDTVITDNKKISIKEGKKIHRIDIDEILYIKGLKEYVVWHTAKGQLITLHSLSHLCDYLGPLNFIQTHRSYIVNVQKADVIEYGFIHVGTEQIPIGRSYREKVKECFKLELE